MAKYQNRSAANCTPTVAARAAQWHDWSRGWRSPVHVCNRAKSFGAAAGCDDPGPQRGFGECNFHRCRSIHQPMTSFRQIEANRRNALRSTGPTTEDGKRRSRQNAVRHGLSAETVVEMVEDIDDYRGFEAAIIADHDARTAVERELVLRLASLLWRLRRATMIETELLRIQAEILRDRRSGRLAGSRNMRSPIPGNPIPPFTMYRRIRPTATRGQPFIPFRSRRHNQSTLRETSRIASYDLPISTMEYLNGWTV